MEAVVRQAQLGLIYKDRSEAANASIVNLGKLAPHHKEMLRVISRLTVEAEAHPDRYPTLASDGRWLTASQRDLAGICHRTPDTVSRWTRDLRSTGYLLTRREGRRLAYRVSVGMVVDDPDRPSPKRSSGTRTDQTLPFVDGPSNRREALGDLRDALRSAAFALVIVIFGPDRRHRPSTSGATIGIGHESPASTVATVETSIEQPSTFAPTVADDRAETPQKPAQTVEIVDNDRRQPSSSSARPHDHDHEIRNEMTHEACADGRKDDAEHNFGWPFRITKDLLRDVAATDRLYEHACERGWIAPSEQTRLGFHAVAEQTIAKAKNPARLFTFMVREKKWLKSTEKGQGGITQKSEQRAVERLKRSQAAAEPAQSLPAEFVPNLSMARPRTRKSAAEIARAKQAKQRQSTPGKRLVGAES